MVCHYTEKKIKERGFIQGVRQMKNLMQFVIGLTDEAGRRVKSGQK